MKKLMFVAAAALCGSVFAGSEITSANIVGYNTSVPNGSGTRAPLFGLCFTPVSGKAFTLADLKPVEGTMNVNDDLLQAINPTTLSNDGLYAHCDKTTADAIAEEAGEPVGSYDNLIGWWDVLNGEVGDEDFRIDSLEVTPGSGFMGMFESGNEVSFVSAGEAPTVTTSILVNKDGVRAPIFNNYIPKTIKLGYFAPVDGEMNVNDDLLQEINPTTLSNDGLYAHCDKTTADAIAEEAGEPAGSYDNLIGWWDVMNGEVGDEDFRMDNKDVVAGFGFMGMFESGNEIHFQLPSSIAE